MVIPVQDMLIDILKVCKVVEMDEVPTATELADTLRTVNMMLNTWSDRNLMVQGTVRAGFALTAGKYSYTIGPAGADIIYTKPSGISTAFVRDAGGNDWPVDITPKETYDSYDDKLIATGRPEEMIYELGQAQQAAQVGTITLYPIPDAANPYTLYPEMYLPLVEFVNLTDTITFDKGAYFEAIKYNGAMRVWGGYYKAEIPFPPMEMALAQEAMRILENINSKQMIAVLDVPSKGGKVGGGGYDVYSDE